MNQSERSVRIRYLMNERCCVQTKLTLHHHNAAKNVTSSNNSNEETTPTSSLSVDISHGPVNKCMYYLINFALQVCIYAPIAWQRMWCDLWCECQFSVLLSFLLKLISWLIQCLPCWESSTIDALFKDALNWIEFEKDVLKSVKRETYSKSIVQDKMSRGRQLDFSIAYQPP